MCFYIYIHIVINVKFCGNHGNHFICLAHRVLSVHASWSSFPFYGLAKFVVWLSRVRARIGIEIIYSLPAFLVDMA